MSITPFSARVRVCATVFAIALQTVPAVAVAHAIPSAHVPDIVASQRVAPVGRADPAGRVLLAVSLPQRNQPALYALLRDLYDPASPSYRHYLSVAGFTERFGAAAGDYAAARAFFAAGGLNVGEAASNRGLITLEGPVAAVERVFHVTLGLYRHPTENRLFTAPDREPSVDLAVPLLHVTGLDDYERPRSRRVQRAGGGTPTGSGPGGNFIGSDVRAAYVGDSGLTGAGQSVGLMELGPYDESDVKLYFATVGQTLRVPVVGVSADGTPPLCLATCNDGEQALDIEYAISMAPGLAQMQVYVGRSPEAVLNRMASDDSSAQLSTSWGWSVREYPTDHAIFLEMAAQGQTLLTASGDYSSLKASQPWPEEDGFITAVGGTDLKTVSPGGAWAGETGWADSAGGPALSKNFPIQSYQLPFVNSANAGSRTRRNVPDIAGDADTDNYECYNGRCEGGWGGTSFAAPIWAGFVALANERAARMHLPPVGFINPLLYALGGRANYDSLFHDQVRGVSGAYSSTFSFDLVTGLGSPQNALIDALVGSHD